jgi:hypothetical protein
MYVCIILIKNIQGSIGAISSNQSEKSEFNFPNNWKLESQSQLAISS